uniref:Uncharacterized protein n=1 Tax=Anguilla anguilla TaxID=7936 RepID=A0A0E9RHB6_ANGAN
MFEVIRQWLIMDIDHFPGEISDLQIL